MNKTAIKNFAIWARNKLIADISYRAGLMGITADGIQNALPQSTGTTEFYDIGTSEPYAIAGDAVKQRRHLVELIRAKEKDTNYRTAYKYVLEEVAYTWFNRLIAVRFMEVNDYLPSHIRVLSSDSGKMEPDLVTTPFDAELSFTRDEEQQVYQLKQENKIDELFRILFIKQCNALSEILPALFEKTSDYTELLLNLSVIDQDGVVYHLVHDIPEEDFDVERGGQVEIIGWLYQFYNTEQNELVYDGSFSSSKIPKELLPAATTIYTPDWVVRYMVENSLGRLWVEGHPNSDLKAGWKYYLEDPEQNSEGQGRLAEISVEYTNINPEDIKVIDPCMGSGHILVYAFEVLIQIYESVGYSQRDAVRSILENNLYGLDIDDRAFQMAYFAVMMKARQYNRRILNGEYEPKVYSIQESNNINRNQLRFFGAGMAELDKKKAMAEMTELLDIFKDAKEYGSILTVNQYDWDLLQKFVSSIEPIRQLSFDVIGIDETSSELNALVNQGQVLAQNYWVVFTNPPYLGSPRFSPKLDKYVKKNYQEVKADLSMVMYKKAISSFARKNGFIAFITTSSWMFLSSFEKLRAYINNTLTISSLVDFGTELFEGKVGHNPAVSWVTRRSNIDAKMIAIRLVDYCYSQRDRKEPEFFKDRNRYIARQSLFNEIPGSPMAYWASASIINAFQEKRIDDIGASRSGMQTGNNNLFLRLWYEVDGNKLKFDVKTRKECLTMHEKWIPQPKGGAYRKWYGNLDYVVNFAQDGRDLQNYEGTSIIKNPQYYFREGVSWSHTTSSSFSARYMPTGCIFNVEAPAFYPNMETSLMYVLGFLNTKVLDDLFGYISQTMHYMAGDMAKIPIVISEENRPEIERIVTENVNLARKDWDSFETSWDFRCHPLVNTDLCRSKLDGKHVTVEECFRVWSDECDCRFGRLKTNEEELNCVFIGIYGLQNELTPEVEDRDVSIRRADLQRDIKSLLSYAVGCMFGRYSIDTDGLAYAGGSLDSSKYTSFSPDTDNVIPITDEEYLEDDIVSRLCTWLKVVYGESTLEENLDFIAKALGNKGSSSREIIRNYFLNDFFKDHCQTYSVTGSGKRPIYWLFDSGKQNGFKALIYLHRYNADTIGNLRIDYLHRMQRIYESEISRMQDMIDHSTNAREVVQATKRCEKLTKQLKECREYDEKLAHLALSRIELDLDDGVKKNYRKIQTANDGKFYEVLADSKNIMAKE